LLNQLCRRGLLLNRSTSEEAAGLAGCLFHPSSALRRFSELWVSGGGHAPSKKDNSIAVV